MTVALSIDFRSPSGERTAAPRSAPEIVIDGKKLRMGGGSTPYDGWDYRYEIPLGTLPCKGGSASASAAVTSSAGDFSASGNVLVKECGNVSAEQVSVSKNGNSFGVREKK